MSEFTFGKPIPTDALRISILFKVVYIQTYAEEGITVEFANFINQRFSPEIIEEKIKQDPDQFVVAYYQGNPVGVAEIIYQSTCPIRKTAVPELSKLYVLKRFYGKGIGFGLLIAVEVLLYKKELLELNLEVYLENDRAIRFYKRQGFNVLGKVDFPMETNTYKNLVMNKAYSSKGAGIVRPLQVG